VLFLGQRQREGDGGGVRQAQEVRHDAVVVGERQVHEVRGCRFEQPLDR
jgi:hypothetical protein